MLIIKGVKEYQQPTSRFFRASSKPNIAIKLLYFSKLMAILADVSFYEWCKKSRE